jgi:hypothetical protein
MNRYAPDTKDTLRTPTAAGDDPGGWWVEPLPTQGGGPSSSWSWSCVSVGMCREVGSCG